MKKKISFQVPKGLAKPMAIPLSGRRSGFSYDVLDLLIAKDPENLCRKNKNKPVDVSLGNYRQQQVSTSINCQRLG